MPTSLSDIKVKNSTSTLVIKPDDITINDVSILGQNNFANKDLSNLSTAGQAVLDAKQDTATAVNYDNISNCITEIPQDIKLELNNGTLTLKAGSKVYVPNGFESDGTTPKFDVVTTSRDVTYMYSDSSITQMLFYNTVTSSLTGETLSKVSSGATASPSSSYVTRYDTTVNKILRSLDGSTWSSNYQNSLPICIQTITSGTGITSIDQIFNGFGYIGSTVFALPGVKGLIPNGRNADGTLKNIVVVLNKVVTDTKTEGAYTYSLQINYASTMYGTMYRKYKEDINYNFSTYSNEVAFDYTAGIYSTDSNGKITSLTPKTAFHALDYNDSSTISGWAMPSSRYIDLTLGASGATYTAPANGWVCLRTNSRSSSTPAYSSLGIYGAGFETTSIADVAVSWVASVILPVKKGQTFWAVYGTTVSDYTTFRFFYAEGENV